MNKNTPHPAEELGVCPVCIDAIDQGMTGTPEFGTIETEIDGRTGLVCENCHEMLRDLWGFSEKKNQ